jgi:hypothetical protein
MLHVGHPDILTSAHLFADTPKGDPNQTVRIGSPMRGSQGFGRGDRAGFFFSNGGCKEDTVEHSKKY